MAMMVAGAGAPYFVLVATGMHYASAAESGVLLGGTMPLFAALLSAAIDRERFGASRLAGFALVVIAMAAIGGVAVVHGHGLGRWLVVAGAALWAVYTHAYQRSGLAALPAAGIIAAWSTILLAPFALMEGTAALFGRGAGRACRRSAVAGRALRHRGARLLRHGGAHPRLLARGADRRPAAGLGGRAGHPVLGEVPSPLTLGGVVLVVVGVALATGAVKLGGRRAVASGA